MVHGAFMSASMVQPDTWRPRGAGFLSSVGHGRNLFSKLDTESEDGFNYELV
jgi:hypothetical protein